MSYRRIRNVATIGIEEVSDQKILTIGSNPSGCLACSGIVALNHYSNETARTREAFDHVRPVLGCPRYKI